MKIEELDLTILSMGHSDYVLAAYAITLLVLFLVTTSSYMRKNRYKQRATAKKPKIIF